MQSKVGVENNQERIGGKDSLCIFFIELTYIYIYIYIYIYTGGVVYIS